jgi:hypothetical protein
MTSCICKSGRQWTEKILHAVTAAERVCNKVNYDNILSAILFLRRKLQPSICFSYWN